MGNMKTLSLLIITVAAAMGMQPKTAEEWAAKAARHEAAAERIKANQGYNAMRHKWPAMANGAENRERELARQARETEAALRKSAARNGN